MTKKTSISVEELFAHIEELNAKGPNTDRPEGFYTIREMGRQLFLAGKCASVNAGKTAVYRMLDELPEGTVVEKLDTVVIGRTGRRSPCTAFKIVMAADHT